MEDAAAHSVYGLSNRNLAARIAELAGHLDADTHRWLVLLAEFDRRHGWSDGYTRSCRRCCTNLPAARSSFTAATSYAELGTSATFARVPTMHPRSLSMWVLS